MNFTFLKPLPIDGVQISLHHFEGMSNLTEVKTFASVFSCSDIGGCSWVPCFEVTTEMESLVENGGIIFCNHLIGGAAAMLLEMRVDGVCVYPQNSSVVLQHSERKK